MSVDVDAGIELEEVVNSTDRKLTTALPTGKKLLKANKKLLADSIKKQ